MNLLAIVSDIMKPDINTLFAAYIIFRLHVLKQMEVDVSTIKKHLRIR